MVRSMAVRNSSLSAAVLLCGLNYTDVANSADVFNLAVFGERYVYRIFAFCNTYKLLKTTRG